MRSGEWRERADDLLARAGLGAVSPKVLVAVAVVVVVAVAIAAARFWPFGSGTAVAAGDATVVRGAATTSAATGGAAGSGIDATGSATATATAWVHVVGAIRHPGVYEIEADARVADAIEAAGGVLGNGAPEGVNLARPVVDGEQIVVPTAEQWEKGEVPGAAGVGAAAAGVAGGTGAAAGTGEAGAAGAPIDINSADLAALDTLPGVGPSTAQKIVSDREANGPFSSPEDLGRVPGIGPRKLEALKGLIVAK